MFVCSELAVHEPAKCRKLSNRHGYLFPGSRQDAACLFGLFGDLLLPRCTATSRHDSLLYTHQYLPFDCSGPRVTSRQNHPVSQNVTQGGQMITQRPLGMTHPAKSEGFPFPPHLAAVSCSGRTWRHGWDLWPPGLQLADTYHLGLVPETDRLWNDTSCNDYGRVAARS
ncbi:hypothetical protein BD289DRAFT_222315 [Coniella lustricola]|uniref:Uncharacterized protein n=1 Tax=Coniella lustricola TaxID=2025994 RepID=A0A2T3AB56_9PEZI|nr:hypothetical protein BD289DRAFT_222315 [Coniella lustricola]